VLPPIQRRRRRRQREIAYEELCQQFPALIAERLKRYKRFPTQAEMAWRLGAADEVSVRRLLRDHRTRWSALKRAYHDGAWEGLSAHLEAHRAYRPEGAPDS
jgi:hypothetical protein